MTDWAEVYRANVDGGLRARRDAARRGPVARRPGDARLDRPRRAGPPGRLPGRPARRPDGRRAVAGLDRTARRRARRAVGGGAGRRAPELGRGRGRDARGQRQPGPGLERARSTTPTSTRRSARERRPRRCGGRSWRRIAPRMLGESADAVGEVPDYELFRAFFSRRSRTQMTRLGYAARTGHARRAVHLRPARRRPAGARARTLRPGVAGAEHRSERRSELARGRRTTCPSAGVAHARRRSR